MTLIPTRRVAVGSLAMSLSAIAPEGWVSARQAQPGTSSAVLKPGRMIVPLPPGSSPDIAARLFVDAFSRHRGHSIIVENKVGGGGTIAGETFAQIPPGEALFFGMGDLLTVAPLMQDRSPFADRAAFVPISSIATDLMAVVVPASLPVRSLREVIDYARGQPGALNWYATPGTSLYIAFNAFLKRRSIDAVFVSFRGLMLMELAQGHVHLALGSIAAALPYVRAGSVRLLAVSSTTRTPIVPDLPTTAEADCPDLLVEGVHGIFGWRGMPEATREALSSDAQAVLASPSLIERYAAVGLQARSSTPTAFVAELAAHRDRWTMLAREFGEMPKQ
ncbi:Bug family tripartite tricarboxylate transporter substrate binding protein [Dankookia sp. GCM10030260]